MSAKNIALMTLLGACYLAVLALTVIVHPGAVVSALGLPAVHQATMSEVD